MKRIIILLAIAGLLQSCSSIYIPAVRSIPLLEKKGEFQAEAGISTNSLYMNGSYAFTNKIAASINGNLSYRNFSNRYDAFTDIYKPPPVGGYYFDWPDTRGKFAHRYGEISVGRINMLPNFPINMKLEIFGGMGMGRATDIDLFRYDNRYKTDYYSFFGQGNFGIKWLFFETGASFRLAYSRFNYTADTYNYGNKEYTLHQTNIDMFHVEPMFFNRMGKGNWKFIIRVGINLAFTINPNEEYAEFRGFNDNKKNGNLKHTIFHFSIGLSYRIKRSSKQRNILPISSDS